MDVSRHVLLVQVVQDSVQRMFIFQQRYAHVQRGEHPFSVSLEHGRVDVVPFDVGEVDAGVLGVMEEAAWCGGCIEWVAWCNVGWNRVGTSG